MPTPHLLEHGIQENELFDMGRITGGGEWHNRAEEDQT
jgi:hypothetical protein